MPFHFGTSKLTAAFTLTVTSVLWTFGKCANFFLLEVDVELLLKKKHILECKYWCIDFLIFWEVL